MSENVAAVIKQSIAYRAKYRLEQGGTPTIWELAPYLVVPHPKNRGGDPVKSMRAIHLSSLIAQDGCDTFEATSGAVAVAERKPEDEKPGDPWLWSSLQKNDEKQIQADPDMAVKINSISACAASLAHSHFNCVMRNVLAAKLGCECQATLWKDCKCLTKPLFNENGNGCYSFNKMEQHDRDWSQLCSLASLGRCSARGSTWKILKPH